MSNKPFLSVIVPSYNEARNLERGVVPEILKFLKQQAYEWELIFSDDGSTDGTREELQRYAELYPNVRVLANAHAGKGPTVMAGMQTAQGDWRLFTDFDQSTPLSEVNKLLEYKDEYSVIIGSREGEGAVRDKEPIHRHLMGRVFNGLVQILTVYGIQDTQCGFKLFSEAAVNKVFPHVYVYGHQPKRQDAFTGAFDVELLFLARKYQFAIKEVPIAWKHHETTRVNPIKDSLRMFKDIIAIRLADLQGKYA